MSQNIIRDMRCPREPNQRARCWTDRELRMSPGCHIYRGDSETEVCPFKNLCDDGMHSKQWLAGLPPLFCRDVAVSGRVPAGTENHDDWLDIWSRSNILFYDEDRLGATKIASAFATAVLFSASNHRLLWLDVASQSVPLTMSQDPDIARGQRYVVVVPILVIDGLDDFKLREHGFSEFIQNLVMERVKSRRPTCFVAFSKTHRVISSLLHTLGVGPHFQTVTAADVEVGQTPLLADDRKQYYKNAIEMCTKHNLTFGSFCRLMDVVHGYREGTLDNRLRKVDVEEARRLGLLPIDLVVRQPYDDLPDYLDKTFIAGISSP